MKIQTIVASLLVVGSLAAGGFTLAPSFAGENAPAQPGERPWLSIAQVHQKLEAAGYRAIEKIERERGGYEVRATDRNGARIKLYVNPQTGEVMDQRGAGKRERAAGERRAGNAAAGPNCNERRCRDDLPPQAAPATPAAK